MRYRTFGKTGEEVSILAFGAMRLPTVGGVPHRIDEERATRMLRSAIDRGVNYVDTAYPYHGRSMTQGGASEPFLARALRDGYREKVKIATKLPSWLVQSREDMDRLLNEQLERLETECIEFYLIHALNERLWRHLGGLGVAAFLDSAIADGRIRHAGFSYHDDGKAFRGIVDGYEWSFCMFQYSYVDENFQAGRAGLEYAASKGLGIAIMEPLRGGSLAGALPPRAQELLDAAQPRRPPVEWALRWVWNHPEVSVVLSGMSTQEQVDQNLAIAETADANSLTAEELERIEGVKEVFAETVKVPCTACGYCMECPAGVDIPKNFALYNNYFLMDGAANAPNHRISAVVHHGLGVPPDARAERCVACHACEEHCPQGIAIAEELEKVAELFRSAPENAILARRRSGGASEDA